MKVPINPQTNAPAGQLGYEKPVDVTAGTRALAEVVGGFAKDLEKQQKDRELFDVHRALVDETNNLATDFEAKKTAQPLGAQNFVQQVNAEYNTRHQALVEDFRKRGYSNDAVDEFSSRLGTMRSLYVAQAIDFESKSNYAKVHNDSQQMVIGLTQYAGKNPNAVGSALDEYRVSLTHSGLDQIEQEKLYQTGRTEILQGARDGFVLQHPDAVVQLFDPQHVVTSTANSPDGTVTPITTQAIKPNGQLADNIVAGLKNRGLSDHIARGVAAGIAAESRNDPNATGPKYGAHGLGQWLGPRRDALFAKYGKNPTGSQQLDFLVSELNGGDAGGKAVLAQADEVSVLHSYIKDFMRPKAGKDTERDIQRGLAALGRKVSAHAEATAKALVQPVAGRSYNVEDAIQELGMTADQAQQFVKTGKDTRSPSAQIALGNIDVSQITPVKNPDGSVSTVRSISIEQDGKTYLIPTVVNGQVVSNDAAIASFRETGRHLGIFTDEKSADAYAQKLHESEARRVSGLLIDENGKTGIPALDMATEAERFQMLSQARTLVNEHQADAKSAQQQVHQTWYNDFLNKLQDGNLTQVDLNRALAGGQITDYNERMKAQGILDDKTKKNISLDLFHQMVKAGGKFNPFDDNAQKAADAGFENGVKYEYTHEPDKADPFRLALSIWQRTGILPKQGAVMIRGGLIGTDAVQVEASASVASNMLKQNPNAFAGVDGGQDIGMAAANYAHYVDDLGLSATQAAQKIAQENSPEFKAKVKANEPERNTFINTITGDKTHSGIDIQKTINDSIFGEKGWGSTLTFGAFDPVKGKFGPTQQAEAKQTYLELALDHYDKYHDPAAAQSFAARQMGRFYGVEEGRLLKYPATKAYPEIMGSREYIFDQAKGFVDQAAGFAIPKEDIFLQPTASGSTAQAFRAGKPPPYEIVYLTHENDQPVYHHIPGKVFVADVDEARRAAAIAARRIEQQHRTAIIMPGLGVEMNR